MNWNYKMKRLLLLLVIAVGSISMIHPGLKTYEPKVHVVVMKDSKFVPAELTIKKGDTVKWINQDIVFHDVTDRKSKSWKSGEMKSKAVWQRAITESADYYCSLHVIMEGKIIVR